MASKQVSLNLDWNVRGFMDDNCVLDFSPVQLFDPVFHTNSHLFMLQLKYCQYWRYIKSFICIISIS